MSNTVTKATTNEDEVILRWKVHLAREEPGRLAIVLAVAIVIGTLAYLMYQSPIAALIMVFALIGMLSDFVLPTTFTITCTKVTASTPLGLRTIKWEDVRKVYVDDAGLKLSPLRRQSRLESFRGVYLRFGDRREEVTDIVKRMTARVDE